MYYIKESQKSLMKFNPSTFWYRMLDWPVSLKEVSVFE